MTWEIWYTGRIVDNGPLYSFWALKMKPKQVPQNSWQHNLGCVCWTLSMDFRPEERPNRRVPMTAAGVLVGNK